MAEPEALRFGQPMVLVLDGIGPEGGAPRTWAFAPERVDDLDPSDGNRS